MSQPRIATVDPVDGTLYIIYEDSSVWAYRPRAKERLLEGWRRVEGRPAGDQSSTASSSASTRSASSSL